DLGYLESRAAHPAYLHGVSSWCGEGRRVISWRQVSNLPGLKRQSWKLAATMSVDVFGVSAAGRAGKVRSEVELAAQEEALRGQVQTSVIEPAQRPKALILVADTEVQVALRSRRCEIQTGLDAEVRHGLCSLALKDVACSRNGFGIFLLDLA